MSKMYTEATRRHINAELAEIVATDMGGEPEGPSKEERIATELRKREERLAAFEVERVRDNINAAKRRKDYRPQLRATAERLIAYLDSR